MNEPYDCSTTPTPKREGINTPQQPRELRNELRDPKTIASDLITARDLITLDPEERGQEVMNFFFTAIGADDTDHAALILRGPSYWDLLCFANAFICQAAVGSGDEDFISFAKAVNSWVYNAHYSYAPDHPMISESREDRLTYWAEKTEALNIKESPDGLQANDQPSEETTPSA